MKYKAALFDMNGVIVDDEKLHEAAFTNVLTSRGFQFDHKKYLRYFAGKTDDAGFVDFYATEGKKLEDLEQLGREKAEAYQELANDGLSPYPGIIDYINALKDSGVRLALVTSSIRLEAETVLEVFGLTVKFELVITADEIENSKPDPEGYLKAVAALGLSPHDCFIIEDAPSGVAAAHAAGIACLAVTNTHSAQELDRAQSVVDKLDKKLVFPLTIVNQ